MSFPTDNLEATLILSTLNTHDALSIFYNSNGTKKSLIEFKQKAGGIFNKTYCPNAATCLQRQDLQSFLGYTNRYIREYSEASAPHFDLETRIITWYLESNVQLTIGEAINSSPAAILKSSNPYRYEVSVYAPYIIGGTIGFKVYYLDGTFASGYGTYFRS